MVEAAPTAQGRPVPTLVPGDRGWPVVGRLFDYVRDPVALMRHQWETYGPVSPFNAIFGNAALLLGPDACGEALRNADKALANEPAWGRVVGPFFKRGLMLLDFEEHHAHRRIMQQAFTRDRLVGYADAMHPAVRRGTARWRPTPGFRAYPHLKQLTLDIATEIFMGGAPDTSVAEMERVNAAFIACVQAATGVVRADLPFTRWGRAHRGRRVLEEFLRHYLPQRRATRTDDLFSVLCHIETDDGERFSDDDVVNHMVFLMMAAHDTSTFTTSNILQLLGQHRDWQERCREESLALGPDPTLAEVDSLESLDLVMKEVLRLRPPVPVLARQAVKDTVIQGHKIEAGTYVVVGLQWSHLMPELWSDPERFDPERFGPDRREDRSHRHAWEPFGGGVHKCIGLHFAGMEVKSILHHLLRTHEWSVPDDYVPTFDNHSLPIPEDGQPIDLSPLRSTR